MKVVNQRLLILPDPKKEKTEGGIVIPDTAKDKPISGIIKRVPIDLDPELKNLYKPGIRVWYFSYSGTRLKLKLDGDEKETEYEFIRVKEILGIEE